MPLYVSAGLSAAPREKRHSLNRLCRSELRHLPLTVNPIELSQRLFSHQARYRQRKKAAAAVSTVPTRTKRKVVKEYIGGHRSLWGADSVPGRSVSNCESLQPSNKVKMGAYRCSEIIKNVFYVAKCLSVPYIFTNVAPCDGAKLRISLLEHLIDLYKLTSAACA
jgi:hypothetical protein